MKKSMLSIMLAVILFAALSVVPHVQAALPVQDASDSGPVYNPNPNTKEDLIGFWTPERMAAAQPVPYSMLQHNADSPEPARNLLTQADGPAQFVLGNIPAAVGSAVSTGSIPGKSSDNTISLNYAFAFNRAPIIVSRYKAFPQKTHGKLYYTNSAYGPGTFVCSGTSVTSGPTTMPLPGPSDGNQNLILTAASCLNSGGSFGTTSGTWSDNLLFVPGRNGGANPNGTWGWTGAWVNHSWVWDSNEDWREDYGFIVATSNTCGTLSKCVGSQGIAWNQGPVEQFAAYGYPSDPPFDGGTIQVCYSSTAVLDGTGLSVTDRLPLGIGCDQTAGATGGAWVVWDKPAAPGYVNSVTNYLYPAQPRAMYGSYFSTSFYCLWQNARVNHFVCT